MPIAQQHQIRGFGLASLYCLAIGVVFVLSAVGSLAARRSRGTEARNAGYRASERWAIPQLKIGAVLTVVGAVCLLIWWVAFR
jgi:ABC-type nickel/cobalt efflux system permease component RcnA